MPPRSSAGFPAVKVNYYRRMKLNRVYPVTVTWGERPRPLGSVKTVTLRLLGAGGQIVPSEQLLDATRPDIPATFFVTPLAYGWLRAQRLEILVAGRKVQEVPLASRVTCQCWAGFWFLMALIVPILILWLRTIDPAVVGDGIRTHIPGIPAIANEHAPMVGESWDKFWEWKASITEHVLQFNRERLLAFPAFLIFLLLSLVSLFTHRDKRARRWSEEIGIPAE